MHSIPYCSDVQMVARLSAKDAHAETKPMTRAERREWRRRRREFRAEQRIALVRWVAAALSHSVEL